MTRRFPSRDDLAAFIAQSGGTALTRDIAKSFALKGQERALLRQTLREMEKDKIIERGKSKTWLIPGNLPEAVLVEVTGLSQDGEITARPADWKGRTPPPLVYLNPDYKGHTALAPGDRVMARLRKTADGEYEGRAMHRPEEAKNRIVGVFMAHKGGGMVEPVDRSIRHEFFVPQAQTLGAQSGDLVTIEISAVRARQRTARIVERLGAKDDPYFISLISIHSHGIPTEFSKEAMAEAARGRVPDLDRREDLCKIPLVTIDGADARDFDDAVFAEPDPARPGGWHIIVAIADVSWYVTPGSGLDRDALSRGNSTYFADRVVPMLPEALSNDLCSLRPHEPRATIAAHLWIDDTGNLKKFKFVRGLMRSAARLTYEQAQAARDGNPDDTTRPLLENVIHPLYAAFKILDKARAERGALELDLPERKAKIDDKGNILTIIPRTRLDSHRLIEEFMILANVAAATALEEKNAPCVYRAHDRPDPAKLAALRDFLKSAGYNLPRADEVGPAQLNGILKKAIESDEQQLISTLILRSQSQACYSPKNIGHFGLALTRYAHFTSPIRRYADLLVHRSLVRAYGLGAGGLSEDETEELGDIAQHISTTERRSMAAERDTMNRFTALYLSKNIGETFKGRISGVTRFGLFICLDDTGADGIVPVSTLPSDRYYHDERRHCLVGKHTGITFHLATPVTVCLIEASPLKGSTVFELVGVSGDDLPRPAPGASQRGQRHSRNGRNDGSPGGNGLRRTQSGGGGRNRRRRK